MYWLLEKLLLVSGLVEQALAQFEDPPGGGTVRIINPISNCSGANANFGCVINKIIDGLFTISIPIVSVMVLVGGFQILFATGNPEKLQAGKKTIIYAVVGFAVILLAKSVVLIIRDFFGG